MSEVTLRAVVCGWRGEKGIQAGTDPVRRRTQPAAREQNDGADDGADDDHDGDFRIVEAARGGNERGAEIAPGGGETQDTAHLRF